MSDSSQSPSEGTCTVKTVSCNEHHEDCCNSSEDGHGHVHVHHHHHYHYHHCCKPTQEKPVVVPEKAVVLPVIKFGFFGVAVGSAGFLNLIEQVNESSNYGRNGTYKKIQSLSSADASKDILTLSLPVAELRTKYDVLSVGPKDSTITVAHAVRLKEYVMAGGVLLLTCDHAGTVGLTNVLQQFGHTGSFAGLDQTVFSGVSSLTESLSSYFGDSSGVTLDGARTLIINSGQLPPGSKVLATLGTTVLVWSVGGTKGRVVAMGDIELTKINIAGTTVDSDQERFFNNMMAYLFDKVLENT